MNFPEKISSLSRPVLACVSVGILAIVLFGWRYYVLSERLDLRTEETSFLGKQVRDLEENLKISEEEKEKLAEAFEAEKSRNDAFQEEIDKISGTVGTLEKLSRLDPELLQKYSKVYFLNEHYTPSELSLIDEEYLYDDRPTEIHSKVAPFLYDLIDEAKEDDVDIKIISAYRSFGTQAALKSSYRVTYGAGTANQFSADQGYSEHQLGTAIDFTTPALGAAFSGFGNTGAYAWLLDNAHRFGFVISYPEGNDYYQFEPWHWRFVGTDLARELKREDMNFYDEDQRDIDAHLVEIFD